MHGIDIFSVYSYSRGFLVCSLLCDGQDIQGQLSGQFDLSLGSFHVALPQKAHSRISPQLTIMAEDASQKPVQVKLVLLGTFHGLEEHGATGATPTL